MENKYILPINQFSALLKLNDGQIKLIDEEKIMDQLVELLHFTVVKKLTHEFAPTGKTVVYILSQSHLIAHTWPEYNILHIDLVSCVYLNEEEFTNAIHSIFKDTISSLVVKSIPFNIT